MTSRNVYDDQVLDEERQRLKKGYDFAFLASQELIGNEITGKVILDGGSGPRTALGKWLRERECEYYALDANEKFLEDHKEAGFKTIKANLADISMLEDDSVDITHVRFVITFLNPENEKKAFQECRRISRKKLIFMEYDWTTFEGDPITNELRDTHIAVAKKHKIDLLGGSKRIERIGKYAKELNLKTENRRFSRKSDDYSDEVQQLHNALNNALRGVDDPELTQRANKAVEAFDNMVKQKKSPVMFVPADVVSVTILLG